MLFLTITIKEQIMQLNILYHNVNQVVNMFHTSAPSRPVSVKSEGAGTLFEKVELEEEEESDKEKKTDQSVKPEDKVTVTEIQDDK